jgi:hypothetical protein
MKLIEIGEPIHAVKIIHSRERESGTIHRTTKTFHSFIH